MKYVISLSTLFMILLSSQVTYGMVSRPLGTIEKQIFLREVDRIGKKAALLQIQKTKDPKPIKDKRRFGFTIYPCFVLTSQFRPESDDPLATLIFDTIAQKEKEEGYIPETIQKKNHFTLPNNFLEKYTQYWHKEDKIGKYIELQSKFNNKQRLLNVLIKFKSKMHGPSRSIKNSIARKNTKKRKLSNNNDIRKKQKTNREL